MRVTTLYMYVDDAAGAPRAALCAPAARRPGAPAGADPGTSCFRARDPDCMWIVAMQ